MFLLSEIHCVIRLGHVAHILTSVGCRLFRHQYVVPNSRISGAPCYVVLTRIEVVFFTAALFLSGYAIQQRTLRDLRAAIKPKPSPKIILQDQFRKPKDVSRSGAPVRDAGTPEIVIEVRPTLPEDAVDTSHKQQPKLGEEEEEEESEDGVMQQPKKQKKQGTSDGDAEVGQPEKPISRAERRRRIKEEIMKLAEGQERGYYQRRLW